MKKIIIEGNNINNVSEFYDEIERVFTKGLTWKIGRNLNAFCDILRGGFGVFDYEEEITVIWKNALNSERKLGVKDFETIMDVIREHNYITFIMC